MKRAIFKVMCWWRKRMDDPAILALHAAVRHAEAGHRKRSHYYDQMKQIRLARMRAQMEGL